MNSLLGVWLWPGPGQHQHQLLSFDLTSCGIHGGGAEREVAAEHELDCGTMEAAAAARWRQRHGSGCGTTQQQRPTAATAATPDVCQHGDSDSSDGGGG